MSSLLPSLPAAKTPAPSSPTALPDATARDWLLWLLRRRRRYRVVGRSMLPLLQPDDEVLVDPTAYRQTPPVEGDLVLIDHPDRPHFRLVKRVRLVLPTGHCFVLGDNPTESTDSRQFGAVAAKQILGKVVCRFD
ncbi:MAG: nickel-type superoxide dismutase maturation protease [Synechococcales bacterium]|nr:nickel-type superoxide dismutase maturation protease [Synechococcales bacterium]